MCGPGGGVSSGKCPAAWVPESVVAVQLGTVAGGVSFLFCLSTSVEMLTVNEVPLIGSGIVRVSVSDSGGQSSRLGLDACVCPGPVHVMMPVLPGGGAGAGRAGRRRGGGSVAVA